MKMSVRPAGVTFEKLGDVRWKLQRERVDHEPVDAEVGVAPCGVGVHRGEPHEIDLQSAHASPRASPAGSRAGARPQRR
jgi:hypothetical protein